MAMDSGSASRAEAQLATTQPDTMRQIRELLYGDSQRQVEARLTELQQRVAALESRLGELERRVVEVDRQGVEARAEGFAELARALADLGQRVKGISGR